MNGIFNVYIYIVFVVSMVCLCIYKRKFPYISTANKNIYSRFSGLNVALLLFFSLSLDGAVA